MRHERQDWHALPPDTITSELAADAVRGLSAAEARRRLTVQGPNKLAEAAATSPLTIFVRQFASLVIWDPHCRRHRIGVDGRAH